MLLIKLEQSFHNFICSIELFCCGAIDLARDVTTEAMFPQITSEDLVTNLNVCACNEGVAMISRVGTSQRITLSVKLIVVE